MARPADSFPTPSTPSRNGDGPVAGWVVALLTREDFLPAAFTSVMVIPLLVGCEIPFARASISIANWRPTRDSGAFFAPAKNLPNARQSPRVALQVRMSDVQTEVGVQHVCRDPGRPVPRDHPRSNCAFSVDTLIEHTDGQSPGMATGLPTIKQGARRAPCRICAVMATACRSAKASSSSHANRSQNRPGGNTRVPAHCAIRTPRTNV